MSEAARKVLQDALALSAAEREELVGALSTSLDPVSLTPEWRAEVERRMASIEAGDAELLDAEAHLAQLREKLLG